ncbi:hypothetical protein ILUMI_12803 [Ignelater luminosus]|uniref:DC-STAMP domain-containing protein 2 n=1 Tax=Ignelater luminosus TaxID=2038154 RepID=A0A8K0GBF8_IGNLU|nr:hypothetical protein ILUMI_12803 [Ignelater luminosus]
MADYALYWVLTVIRYHARYQSTVKAPNIVGVNVDGNGFLANLLKSIVKAFQPFGVNMEIDTIPCLPDPIPPDYDRYIQIAILLVLCWILTIFEPYGLRLRHSVMCYYHPTRARQRAVWLYNHIMRSRSSFLKYARRQLRRRVVGSRGVTKITCKEYLRANLQCHWMRFFLGSDYQDACLLCGEVFREGDSAKPIRCAKPACLGIYCEQCFNDLQNLCTVCLEPIEYGDLSDVSEEKDSSEEDNIAIKKKKRKKRKKRCLISKCLKEDHDSDSDDDASSLLKDDSETTDSDYTSGTTTDNSYTYQNSKDISGELPTDSSYKFSDREKQNIPDYVSWGTFQDKVYKDDEKLRSSTTVSDGLSSIESEKQTKVTNLQEAVPENEGGSIPSVESIIASIKSEEFTVALGDGPCKVSVHDSERLIKSITASSLVEKYVSKTPPNEPESSFNLVDMFSDDSSVISELNVVSAYSALSRVTDSQLNKGKRKFKRKAKIPFGRFLLTKTQFIRPSTSFNDSQTKKKKQIPFKMSVKEPTVLLQVTEIDVEPREKEYENLNSPASPGKKIKPQHISFSSVEKVISNKKINDKQFHCEVVHKLQKRLNKKSPRSEKYQKKKKRTRNKADTCEKCLKKEKTPTSTVSKRRFRRTKKSRKNKLSSEKSRHSRCRLYKKTLRLCKEAYEKARERRKRKRTLKVTTQLFPLTNIRDSGISHYNSEKVINIVKYTSSESEDSKPKKVDTGVGSSELGKSESVVYKDEMTSTKTEPSSSHSSVLSELQKKSLTKSDFLKSRKRKNKENIDQSPSEGSLSENNSEGVQKPKAVKKRVPLTDRSNQTFSSDVTYESSESVVTPVTITPGSETSDITSGQSPRESNKVPMQIQRCMTCLRNLQTHDLFANTIFDAHKFQHQKPKKPIYFDNRSQEMQQCQNCMYLKDTSVNTSSTKKCFYVDKKKMKFQIPPLNLNFDSPKPRAVDHFKDRVKYEIIRETPRSSTSDSRSPTYTPRSPLNVNYQIYVPRFDKFVTCSTVSERINMPQQTDISKQIDEYRHVQRTKRLQHLFKIKREQNDGYSRDTSPERNVQCSLTASRNRHSVSFNESFKKSYEKQPSHQQVRYNTEAHKQKVKDYYKKISNKQPTDNLSVVTGDQNKFMKFIKGIFRKAKSEAVSEPQKPKLYLEACNRAVITSSSKFPEGISFPGNYTYTSLSSSTSSGDIYLPEHSSETSTRSSGFSLMGSTVSHTRGGGDSQIHDSQQSFTTTRTTTSLPSITANNVNTQKKNHAKINSSDSELSDIEIYFGKKKPFRQIAKHTKTRIKISEPFTKRSSTDSASTPMTSSNNPEEQTPRYSRQPAERDQDPDIATKEVRLMKRFYSSPAIPNYTDVYTSTSNTNMHDICTSRNVNPAYAATIKALHSPFKPERQFNMDMLNENYIDTNHADCQQSCCCQGSTRSKRSSLHRSQDDCKLCCSSEERHPPSVRFSSRTEMHFPHEYDRPCKSPSNSGCYYQHTNKAEEIRDCLPEYSGGEPNKNYKCEKIYRLNKASGTDNPNYQYPHDFCTCNNFEISSNNEGSRRIMDDEASYDSGCSGRSEFPDLVYQNTNEFMDLVNELGETLSQRNKARVRKAMREFEIMSSQNKNLEKPVFDSDSDERLHIQRRRRIPCPACSRCQKKRSCEQQPFYNTRFTTICTKRDTNTSRCPSMVGSPSHPQEAHGYVNRVVRYMDDNNTRTNTMPESPKFHKKVGNPHWELNPRTGEWFKIYNGYYQYDNNSCENTPMSPRQRQSCMCERSPGRYSSRRNSIERQVYNASPRSYRCSNCGCPREHMY